MIALIDSDILCHEIGAVGQYTDEESGELIIRSWSFVERTLDEKIEAIRKAVNADKVLLFLTCGSTAYKSLERIKDLPPYKPNFRFEVAKSRPYKGTRQNPKPFHYWNIYHYLIASYNTDLSIGHEADDAMAVYQWASVEEDTVICSRDKDLRMVPGYHYTWACGKQAEISMYYVDPYEYGHVEDLNSHWEEVKTKKLFGYGVKWFHVQMLVGDSVDNIPGLPGVGPAKALGVLKHVSREDEGLNTVIDMYKEKMGDDWEKYFLEQADLLWMCTDYDGEGVVPYSQRFVLKPSESS